MVNQSGPAAALSEPLPRLLLALCAASVLLISNTNAIGVNFGQVSNSLPSNDVVLQLVQTTTIKKLKIYGADPGVLTTFAGSGIDIVIGADNDQVQPMASTAGYALTWAQTNIVAYPNTSIVGVALGNEILSYQPQLILFLLPALQNLQAALVSLGLDQKVKLSSPSSLGIVAKSFPPSYGEFHYDGDVMSPILDFFAQTGSQFMVNVYPYFAYAAAPENISLDYVLFNPTAVPVYDDGSGLYYTNMFDAQVDAVYAAMSKLGYTNVSLAVTETGWPSAGDPTEAGASVANAQLFNTNLVKHIESGVGTPAKPGVTVDTYIFALYNEDMKPGPTSERNFGLYNPDGTPVYNSGLTVSPQWYNPPPAVVSPPAPVVVSPPPPSFFSPPPPVPALPPVENYWPPPPPVTVLPPVENYWPPPPPVTALPPVENYWPPPPPVTALPPVENYWPPPPPVTALPPVENYWPPPPPVTILPPVASYPPPVPALPPVAYWPPPPVPALPPVTGWPPPPTGVAQPPPQGYPPPTIATPPTAAWSPPPPVVIATPPGLGWSPPPPPVVIATPPSAAPSPSPPPPPVVIATPPGLGWSPPPPPVVTSTPPAPGPAAWSPPPPVVISTPPAPGPAAWSPPPPFIPTAPVPTSPTVPIAPGPGSPSWCVAKADADPGQLQIALDWACSTGGADCSVLQSGGACFTPNTIVAHASYAFDSYYELNNRNSWDCFFSDTAELTAVNPSFVACNFP